MTRTADREAGGELDRLFRGGIIAGLSDSDLLGRLEGGDGDPAFEALVARHSAMVRRACLDLLGDPVEAEEACQATFVTLAGRAGSIRSGDSLAGWLHRVAVRASRRARSRATRRRALESRAGQARAAMASDPPGPCEILARDELRRALHEELDRLPDRHRRPLILCGLEGLSLAEAAGRLGWSEGSVRGRLARGKARLRDRLSRRGFAPPAVALAVDAWSGAADVSVAGGLSWAIAQAAALLIALGATIAASALTAPPSSASPPPSPSGHQPIQALGAPAEGNEEVAFRVRVVDPAGKAVSGARVYFNADFWALPEAAGVAADGSIRFERPGSSFAVNFTNGARGPGKTGARVFAIAEGFGMGWTILDATTRDGKPAMRPGYDLTIRLVEDHPVSGRVVGPSGRPVAGVSVSLDEVESPESGRFDRVVEELRRLNTGPYYGFPGGEPDPMMGPKGLAEGRVIPPVVTDAQGRYRFAGIGRDRRVGLSVSGPGIGRRVWSSLTVDGLDEVALAVRRRWPRHPSPTGQAVAKMDFGGTPVPLYGPIAEVDVDTERTIAGVVRDARTSRPLPGRPIRVETGSGLDSYDTTDDEGRYRVVRQDLMDRVLVRVEVEGSAYLGAAREVADVSRAGERAVDFALEAGVVVSGRVLEAGTGRALPARDSDDCPSGHLRAGFLYYLPLAGNRTAVDGDLARYYREPRQPARVEGDYVGTIYQDGAFRVVVPPGPGVLMVEPNTGLGVSALITNPWPESSGYHLRFPYALIARRTPADGAGPGPDRASLPGAFGPVRLHGFIAYRVVDPASGSGPLDLTITIPRQFTRRVRLVDPEGRAIVGATVSGLVEAGRDRPVKLEGDGFEALALDPIIAREGFAISDDGRSAARFAIKGDSADPWTVTMARAPSLAGRLIDAEGRPIVDAIGRVDYLDPDPAALVDSGRNSRIPRVPPFRTDAGGRFLARGLLPALPFRVTFAGPPARPGEPVAVHEAGRLGSVILAPGEEKDLGDLSARPAR